MNGDLRDILLIISQIKYGTNARWVSLQSAPYGMKIQVDWEDDCHCVYGLGEEEIETANYSILNFLVKYFDEQHEKVRIK